MWRKKSICTLFCLGILGIFGCSSKGLEVHLIPDNYVGPVVVVFNDPNGQPLKLNEEGDMIFEIPKNGVLRVNVPRPKPEVHEVACFYVQSDGKRKELPKHGESNLIQAFAFETGTYTNFQVSEKTLGYTSYVVGLREERDDWVRLRNQATDKAIGRKRLGEG